MYAIPLLLAAAFPTIGPPTLRQDADRSADDVRGAVAKSLPFLERSSAAWRAERKCVTCHQVPFTIWAMSEATRRGVPVDAAKLDDLTAWAFKFCTTDEYKGEKTGGFHLTMAFLSLSQGASSGRDDALMAYPFFETMFAKRQKADGSWREGNQVRLPGAEREADEVDTMWTILAIRSLERLGDKLPAQTRKGLASEREKALAFLKDAKPGRRVDWLALRMLVARECGTEGQAADLLKELRGQQNADGGWGYVRGGMSYPHTTGESLYALGVMGLTGGDPSVQKGWKHLLSSQRPDGSWEARSRQSFIPKPGKVSDVTVHWGTGWATIGLIKTLPR